MKQDDAGLRAAEQATATRLEGDRRFGFHVYRWGKELPTLATCTSCCWKYYEQALAYVSDNTVLIQRDGGSWIIDRSMPT